ncbi:MAG: hypothetical protein NTY23_07385 [Chloroflexi bacterium]|nr:hypothetical protein [Chloroflexota bacterium]
MPITRTQQWWEAGAGILTALAQLPIIVLVALDTGRFYYLGDAAKYSSLAVNILEHHVFSRSVAPPFEPDILLTPGYPAFVAAIFALSVRSEIAVVIIQALLRGLTAWLLVRLGWRLFASRSVGLAAGWAYVFAAVPYLFVGVLSPETLFTTLLMGALVLFASRPAHLNLITAGLLAGLGVLTRPIGLVAMWGLPLVELCRSKLSRAVPRVAILFGVAGLVVAPWLLRNQRLLNMPVLTSVGSYNLLNYVAASTLARAEGTTFVAAQEQVNAIYREYGDQHGPPLNAAQASQVRQEVGMEILLAHPLEALTSVLVDSLNTLRPGVSYTALFLWPGSLPTRPATSEDFSPAWGLTTRGPLLVLTVFLTLFYAILFLLSGIGFVMCLRARNWFAILVIVPVVLALVVAPGVAGNARFRVPFEPLLFLLAALAGTATARRLVAARARR